MLLANFNIGIKALDTKQPYLTMEMKVEHIFSVLASSEVVNEFASRSFIEDVCFDFPEMTDCSVDFYLTHRMNLPMVFNNSHDVCHYFYSESKYIINHDIQEFQSRLPDTMSEFIYHSGYQIKFYNISDEKEYGLYLSGNSESSLIQKSSQLQIYDLILKNERQSENEKNVDSTKYEISIPFEIVILIILFASLATIVGVDLEI